MAENTKPTYVYAHTTKTKNHRIHKAIQKKTNKQTIMYVCFFLVLSLVYTHVCVCVSF